MPRPVKPTAGRRFEMSCLIRGHEAEGRKLIVKRGATNTRVAPMGPDGRHALDGSYKVATNDLIDERSTSVSDVQTAPRFETISDRGGLTIPQFYRDRFGFRPGTAVLLEEREDGLMLLPADVVPRATNAAPPLESLLAEITPENVHPEFDFGPPVGREVL